MNRYPPKFFLRFFRWYCKPSQVDFIEGDLLEDYKRRKTDKGKWRADIGLLVDIILLFRPGIVRPIEGYKGLNSYGMYKNYLSVGWRNLLRNKGYSFINIGGLSIGMMVAILNGLWIWHEFSFNKYFDNYDRIAQVAEGGINFEQGGTWLGTTMTYPLSTELIDKYGQQFKRIVRTSFQSEKILTAGDVKIMSRGLSVDSSAPEMFSLKMMYGTPQALSQPQSVIIAQSVAATLFGTHDPINQTIRINNQTDVTVTDVFEDFPQNTEFNAVKFFTPWSLFLAENKWIEKRAMTDWRNHFIKIYVELPQGPTFQEAAARIKGALQFAPEDLEWAKKNKTELQLYPMSDWHLNPPGHRTGQMEPILMIKLVGAIGIFVLTLACINFINLSTARAEKRAKEIGIRKTIGSVRQQLVAQFYSESFLVVGFSFVLALVLTNLVLPGFNLIASKNISIPWSSLWFWLATFGFILFTSVLAGIYPALYLSSFNPIRALKGTFRTGRLASVPRKGLVVFQFSISVILIIGTIVVYQQVQYAKNRAVGYDRKGLLMIHKRSDDFKGKYEILRHELKNTGVVYEVSESMGPTTEIYSGNNGWDWNGRNPEIDKSFGTLSVSHLHGKTVGWQFIMGRDFDLSIASDSTGIVINESALQFMKLKDPIGEPVSWTWWQDETKVLNYKIIGVVKDMVMNSPYAATEPTIFYLKGHNGSPSWINIKINPQASASEALPKIESVFKKVIPTVPFDYKFADEEYDRKFGKEERIGKLASIFAGLAICISCLGLLGLASFMAETRTKEIGIRKVLGASVAGLWRMLSKDFILLIVVSCVIATPIGFYLLNLWLEKFTYHTDISLWVFVITGAGAIIITLLTISFQTIKVAMLNPVKSLRSE